MLDELVGKTFHTRQITAFYGYADKHAQDRPLFDHVCNNCGKKGRNQLITLQTTKCRCSWHECVGEISHAYFNYLRGNAIRRRRILEFNLTPEFLWSLFLKQNRRCALSNRLITLDRRFRQKNGSSGTASLDRIDSQKGYTEDNVQWVHVNVNFMKQDLDESEFIAFCEDVANHRGRPKEKTMSKPEPFVEAELSVAETSDDVEKTQADLRVDDPRPEDAEATLQKLIQKGRTK